MTTHSFQIICRMNNPPDKPVKPSPKNGKTGISLNPILSVDTYDPDGDSMNISFYDASDDSIIGTVNNIINGETASVPWPGRSYKTTYEWYAVSYDSEFDNTSPTWSFKTKSAKGAGGDGSSPPAEPTNIPPVADASASQKSGFVDELIYFNGSNSYDPDGRIVLYEWDWNNDGVYDQNSTFPEFQARPNRLPGFIMFHEHLGTLRNLYDTKVRDGNIVQFQFSQNCVLCEAQVLSGIAIQEFIIIFRLAFAVIYW